MKWNHFLQWLINGLEKMKKDVIYEQLMGELEPKGVRLINFNKLSAEEGKLLETYFDHESSFSSKNVQKL